MKSEHCPCALCVLKHIRRRHTRVGHTMQADKSVYTLTCSHLHRDHLRGRMKCLEVEIIFIRVIVCLVSLSGCIWHLSDISQIYFSYDTNVNVRFEREAIVGVPGVTICTNVSKAIRQDYMRKRFPESSRLLEDEKLKYFFMGEMLKNLTLLEQMDEATIGYREAFNSCLIMSPIELENVEQNDYVPCERLAPIREYLTYSKKCFFIASQLANEPDNLYKVDHDTVLRDNGFPLFQIKLNNVHLDQVVIFVHSRTTPFLGFMGGQSNGMHLNNTKYSSYTLSYVKTITQLLKPPYKTACKDYTSMGFQTLSHCIVSCKAHYFISHFQGWHPDIPASREYNLNYTFSEIELKQNKTLDKTMAEECLGICTKMEDCESEYYSMSVIGQFERDSHYSEFYAIHGIYIYLPSGLNTRYVHSARLHLTEYICYFASVFSLWFGFSIIAISRALIKAYQMYKVHQITRSDDNIVSIQLKTSSI